jgi:gamma-glutamylcyclotransferase
MWYFSYGSNMDLDDLREWCERADRPVVQPRQTAPALLRNYRLCFNYYSRGRGGGAANIIPAPGETVYGLVMDLSPTDFATVSAKEGAPRYYRQVELDVERFDGRLVRGVRGFQVTDGLQTPDHQPPTAAYLALIVRNARRYGFPADYVRVLESVKTAEV